MIQNSSSLIKQDKLIRLLTFSIIIVNKIAISIKIITMIILAYYLLF